jgi:hypothetical protein
VERVSNWINETEKPESLALYLARRGALYRKVCLNVVFL